MRFPSGCSVPNGVDLRPNIINNPGVGTGNKDFIPICKNTSTSRNFIITYSCPDEFSNYSVFLIFMSI